MSNKAREMKAKGIDVISLTLGEPDFDVPANVKEAAITAIHENYSHYSPIPGFMELREAVSRKLKTRQWFRLSTNTNLYFQRR